jgi:hypothetical protein
MSLLFNNDDLSIEDAFLCNDLLIEYFDKLLIKFSIVDGIS